MKILKWLGLFLVAVVLVVGLIGFVVYKQWTEGPLPQHSGELSVAGLTDKVEILRDSFGVPHIYASNTYDLFFAQGYTQAQDRWWQMEFSRHTGAGRIQELTGRNRDAMSNDIGLRTMGWRRVAEREAAENYDSESLAHLQAFADGVNAYILNRTPSQLAFEYNLLGVTGVNIEIEPWTVPDTLVWVKAMAWNLRGDGSELSNAATIEALSEEMLADLLPPWPHGEKPTMVDLDDLAYLGVVDASSANETETETDADAEDAEAPADDEEVRYRHGEPETLALLSNHPFLSRDEDTGSNNWAVHGDLTETGAPLVANDMHLGMQMPSIWYEIGLHCQPVSEACPYNVTGFQFPPAPLVTAGHNDSIAWGFTDHTDDVLDYYQIRVNPDNELQYEWNGEWRDMIVHEEVIRFGNSDDTVTIQVRETHLGPIINDNQLDADGNITGFNNEDPLAMRWTALIPGTVFQAIDGLNQAQNWDEFRAALAFWDVPSQNVIYADVEGNIGMQNPGRIPIRAAGHTGNLPVPGWTDEYEWLGFIPFDSLPRAFNPERGYIATANQANVPLEYFDLLREQLADEFGEDANYEYATIWDYGYRGERINEMLVDLAPHNAETFRTVYADNKLISAEELMPYLLDLAFEDAAVTDARDWLSNWDYQMHMDSSHAVLYAYFWRQLMDDLFNDQLEGVGRASGSASHMWAVKLLAEDPENAWWDDVRTADVVETRDDILARSFATAFAQAIEEQGEDRYAWRWGALHTVNFVSTPLGISGIGPVEDIVNRGGVETSGGSATVNASGWNAAQGFELTGSAVSQRVVYDLSDWTQSLSIHTTGQSGHPFSPHYDDMIDMWRHVEFKPMLWTREQVEAAAVNTLTLLPK
jgi:penicillin amidase